MEIICDRCGAVIPSPEWKTIRDGDIEHTYFLCPSCGEAYRISTTDGRLRGNIAKYADMASRLRSGRQSEQYIKRVRKLKEDNVKRSRELAEAHPLAPLLFKEE